MVSCGLSEQLLGWFTKRRESLVLRMIKENAETAEMVASEFNEAVKSRSREEVARHGDVLHKYDDEADRARKRIEGELTRGELPPKIREDLLHLTRRLDATMFHCKDASKDLEILTRGPVKIPEGLWSYYRKLSDKLLVCVSATKKMLIALIQAKTEEAEQYVTEVEKTEHEIDELHVKTKLAFSDYDKTIPTSVFLALYDLLKEVEEAADSCENTADQVRMVLIRGQ
jgi:predicted phosphate transport protein (TIGR00153 family)